MNKNKNTLFCIFLGLFSAILFSASLYLEYFSYINIYLNSFLSLASIALILSSSRKALFFTGFFIGILWFYWLSFSFVYYDLSYLIPLVILGLALVYALIFFCLGLIDSVYTKAVLFFALSYFQPFNFNWLQPEILFVNSIFSIQKEAFALLVLSILVLLAFKKYYKLLFVLPLIFALDTNSLQTKDLELKVFMPEISIPQDKKWEREHINSIIDLNNRLIKNAIEHGYDLIILPETAYPLLLNKNKEILAFLLEQSSKIDIVLGSLNKVGKQYYNSSYHFSKKKMQIANKVVLVPFGEAVPLPELFRNYINDIFYEGAEDFIQASNASNFSIKGHVFRNAICYEATTDVIFKDLKDARHMIVISNSAWFTPSIQPILQKQLLRYYAKKYNVSIYHSVNGSENYIIKP